MEFLETWRGWVASSDWSPPWCHPCWSCTTVASHLTWTCSPNMRWCLPSLPSAEAWMKQRWLVYTGNCQTALKVIWQSRCLPGAGLLWHRIISWLQIWFCHHSAVPLLTPPDNESFSVQTNVCKCLLIRAQADSQRLTEKVKLIWYLL